MGAYDRPGILCVSKLESPDEMADPIRALGTWLEYI